MFEARPGPACANVTSMPNTRSSQVPASPNTPVPSGAAPMNSVAAVAGSTCHRQNVENAVCGHSDSPFLLGVEPEVAGGVERHAAVTDARQIAHESCSPFVGSTITSSEFRRKPPLFGSWRNA